jgi:hypothetical protein
LQDRGPRFHASVTKGAAKGGAPAYDGAAQGVGPER